MKICPECKAELIDTAKFCRKCGFNIKKYEEENAAQECFCTECGAKMPADSVFCPECGERVEFDLASEANAEVGSSIGSFDFSALESEAQEQFYTNLLSAFEYDRLSNGMFVIKRIKNNAELIINVPDCVQLIDDGAFLHSSVIEVTLPEGLIKIGVRAFAGCVDLEKINFPSTLRIIEQEAFSGCVQLDATAPDGVRCGKNAFSDTLYTRKLEQLARDKAAAEERRRAEEYARQREFTQGLKFLKKGKSYCVCGYNGKNRNIVIPELYKETPVTEIAEYAFGDYANKYESVRIPKTIKKINANAFPSCSSCTSFIVDEENAAFKSIDGSLYTKDGRTLLRYASGKKETELVIPKGVLEIGYFALGCSTSLKKIVVPEGVTHIRAYAFFRCESLEEIDLPSTLQSLISGDASYPFDGCKKLKTIRIPDRFKSKKSNLRHDNKAEVIFY